MGEAGAAHHFHLLDDGRLLVSTVRTMVNNENQLCIISSLQRASS